IYGSVGQLSFPLKTIENWNAQREVELARVYERIVAETVYPGTTAATRIAGIDCREVGRARHLALLFRGGQQIDVLPDVRCRLRLADDCGAVDLYRVAGGHCWIVQCSRERHRRSDEPCQYRVGIPTRVLRRAKCELRVRNLYDCRQRIRRRRSASHHTPARCIQLLYSLGQLRASRVLALQCRE